MKFIFLGLGALLLVGVAVIASRIKKQAKGEPGFREFVKNPELFEEYITDGDGESFDESEVASWDDEQIHQQVTRFVSGDDDSYELSEALESLIPKTHDALLSILRHGKVDAEQSLDEDSIDRLCDLFDGSMPAEAFPLLEPYLTHPSDKFRKACVLAVAETGLAEALPAVRRAMKDDDEFVRSYALIGVDRANENDRIAEELVEGVLPEIEGLIRRDQNGDKTSSLLAELDADRASSFLLSPEILALENGQLYNILRTINRFDFEISRDQVLSLVNQLRDRELDFPNNNILGESLDLLGKFKVSEDRELLQKYSEHPIEEVAEGAARGLVEANDLGDFRTRLWEKEESGEVLSKEQQLYRAVLILDAEVNNGGHSQYFFNSSGDEWQLALEGLKVMGFKERLAIFDGILALFGEDGPVNDQSIRSDQLADIYTEHEEAFDEFDGRYYQCEENVEVVMMRYVIRNADAFK
ncbi:MAG: DUF4375 domain-containing protein [Planctomycetota bacterium]